MIVITYNIYCSNNYLEGSGIIDEETLDQAITLLTNRVSLEKEEDNIIADIRVTKI